VRFLVASGINPNGLTTMFEKLLSEQKSQPSAVERWFSTHPLTTERVQNVQQEIATLPASSLRNLQTDTRDFQTFKSRVRSLPRASQ
jgi:predicted Zn-dependent protease